MLKCTRGSYRAREGGLLVVVVEEKEVARRRAVRSRNAVVRPY